MNSLYFAQFLVNEGTLDSQEVKELLRQCEETEPGLAVVALAEGAVSASKLAELMPFEKDAFPHLAVAEGLLFASQVEKLQEVRATDGLKLAQALLDSGKMDFVELGRQMAACGAAEGSPIKDAVRRLAEDNEEPAAESETYAEFTELFMRSLMRFMDTSAVIDFSEPECGGMYATHTVSQRLTGSVSFVSGIYASDKIFVEMAQRYSREMIDEADEMAEDSVAEFLNVVNGLFVVDLGKRDFDLDLETPRIGKNTHPMGSHQLRLCVDTGFGAFALVLAADEFTLKERPF
ncbi:MAG: chemotaxis protein CheX [Schwartzia sp.]|nr:chemotaxis protein CheX [Schwartzia sp. (in: firmicutes)]MBR1886582.1 chemotaxis protein CheX [Schwartzia sp. (in: firmicutes)]